MLAVEDVFSSLFIMYNYICMEMCLVNAAQQANLSAGQGRGEGGGRLVKVWNFLNLFELSSFFSDCKSSFFYLGKKASFC